MDSVEIHHYLTSAGTDPYQRGLDELKDLRGRVTIQRRIDRIANGNFGDHQFCRDGVWELRIQFGPGYRVYYGREGEIVIVLLCGGSKGTQSTDIKKAVRYWLDYQQRRKT
jgi:putative addiction module killer protein